MADTELACRDLLELGDMYLVVVDTLAFSERSPLTVNGKGRNSMQAL